MEYLTKCTKGYVSVSICIRTSAASCSVFIVEHKYVSTLRIVLKDRSGVTVDTGIVLTLALFYFISFYFYLFIYIFFYLLSF